MSHRIDRNRKRKEIEVKKDIDMSVFRFGISKNIVCMTVPDGSPYFDLAEMGASLAFITESDGTQVARVTIGGDLARLGWISKVNGREQRNFQVRRNYCLGAKHIPDFALVEAEFISEKGDNLFWKLPPLEKRAAPAYRVIKSHKPSNLGRKIKYGHRGGPADLEEQPEKEAPKPAVTSTTTPPQEPPIVALTTEQMDEWRIRVNRTQEKERSPQEAPGSHRAPPIKPTMGQCIDRLHHEACKMNVRVEVKLQLGSD